MLQPSATMWCLTTTTARGRPCSVATRNRQAGAAVRSKGSAASAAAASSKVSAVHSTTSEATPSRAGRTRCVGAKGSDRS